MSFSSIYDAKWIAAPKEQESPVIERRFFADGFDRAVLNITSLGFFSVLINGKNITDDLFVPVVTDFEERDLSGFLYPLNDQTTHRIYYYRYDITELLVSGENLLEVHLANGWYRQRERIIEGNVCFGEVLKALYSIDITFGRDTFHLYSDGSEVYRSSDIIYSNIFIGEIVDPSAEGRESGLVSIAEPPDSMLCEAQGVADRVIRTIKPSVIGKSGSGTIFDAGENISGVVSITTNAPKGSSITLRFSEELDGDSLSFDSTGANYKCVSGRPQIMTDTFVCDGERRTFCPKFVWHAFRYFEVDGEIESAEVLVIHSNVEVTSTFESSSEGLNFLYDAFIRSQLTNMHGSIPSDCPHRERLGYTGDGQVCAPAAMLLLDSKEFYRKWITDIIDCQDKHSGHVQHTAPLMGGGGGPGGWGCAIVLVPYYFYKQFGEISMLEKCYDSMVKWIRYLDSRSENGIVVREEAGGWCLGDWCTPDKTVIPEAYVNSCYFVKILKIVKEIAAIIGRDASEYAEKELYIAEAIRREYLDDGGGFCGGIQGADVFAVWCGIAKTERVLDIAKKYASLGRFDTGFLCTDLLVELLLENGFEDVALDLLESEEKGSYLYMKRRGATTLWERWSGSGSHNHPMFGASTRHLFTKILGICYDSASGELRLKPRIPRGLKHAKGSLTLPIGTVSIGFEKKEQGTEFSVVLPEGVSAEFEYLGSSRALIGKEIFMI